MTRSLSTTGQEDIGPQLAAVLVQGTLQAAEIGESQAADMIARLAAIIEAADDAIVGKTLEGIIQSWNGGAERLYGYSAEEATGKPAALLTQTMDEDPESIVSRLLAGERIEHYETVRVRKDGSLVDVSLSVSPIFGGGGELVGTSDISRDITARKRAEEELRRANAHKDEFLGLVSHELRTPLTTILGLASVLAHRGDSLTDEQRREASVQLLEDAQRLNDLVENMLVLARLEGDQVDSEPMLLDHTITRVCGMRRARNPHRPIEVHVAGRLPPVLANPTWTEQILANLLTNAEKYSAPGAPISVCIDGDEDRVVVRVLDRGQGISEDDLQALFKAFFRSTRNDARVPGAGLGLAVCRRLVEAQNGQIWVAPREGGGTEFGFSLPTIDALDSPLDDNRMLDTGIAAGGAGAG